MKVKETELKRFSLSVCDCVSFRGESTCFLLDRQQFVLTDFFYFHVGKTAVCLANTHRMSCRLSVGDTN